MNTKLATLNFLATGVLLISATHVNASVIFPEHDVEVTDTVTPIGVSSWQYDFAITNFSHGGSFLTPIEVSITDYRLPYFSDAGITSIQAPLGWSWAIDDIDSFDLGFGAQTLHWQATSSTYAIAGWNVDLGGYTTLGGFSFVADYSPVKAPFSSTYYDGYTITGDPALPGSPNALSAGLTTPLPVTSIPEPEIYAMLLAGLGLLGFMARRRKESIL